MAHSALQMMKILKESARVSGGDRQFPSPSARGQRAYPDSDEEPWGIVNRELAEIIQPPVTPILLDVQSDTVDDCWSRGLVAEQHEKTWLFYTVDNGAVELTSDDKQIPYRVLQMDIARACIMKATLTDVEKKGQLADVTLRNLVCDLKQVNVKYWPHIPQGKNIVRITFVLDTVTLIVCHNVYSKLLLTILPEVHPQPAGLPYEDQIRDLDPTAVENPGLIIEQLQEQLFESKSNIFDGVKLIDLNMNRSLGALLLENHDKKPNVAARAKEINCTEEAVGKGSEVPTGAAKNNV
ncbi:conserved hypothetical protein [Culex quinquefasciatus]|uniref:Uncharacterized protein n=1 Tax=Culex quinquefasciatus TaxID=7176 RepID=B0WAW1_CULQU|nr:conserved hypothetical protein [Culex quinquefasciatus]|eukprot:XP_001845845.1 conserved hypothetical protein [Culex quinquefasciatus]